MILNVFLIAIGYATKNAENHKTSNLTHKWFWATLYEINIILYLLLGNVFQCFLLPF